MADKIKSEKLAAAKKKLKEFKTKQKNDYSESNNNGPLIFASQNNILAGENLPDQTVQVEAEQIVQHSQPPENLFTFFSSPESTPKHHEVKNLQNNYTDGKDVIHDVVLNQQDSQSEIVPISFTAENKTQPLSKRDIFESNNISAEKFQNKQFSIQITNQNAIIEELQAELYKLRLENSTKFVMEIEPLQEQLKSHVQTIGVLVGEKAELSTALNSYQNLVKNNATQTEELQGRLNASRYRVQVLEKEIETIRSSHEKYDGTQQKLCTELENSQEEIKKHKKSLEESYEEISELKQKLLIKTKHIENLDKELVNCKSDLSLCEVRIEQFSSGDFVASDKNVDTLVQQKLYYEQQIQELQNMVQQLSAERDQASELYQSYVLHLNKETSNMAHRIQELATDNERLAKREESLVKHVGDLERQIQQQIVKQKSYNDVQQKEEAKDSPTDDTSNWKIKWEQLEVERNNLQVQIQDQTQQIGSLQLKLEENVEYISSLESSIERIQSETPDSKNLLAIIESDKVAASRAVAQNQELKQQLEEIQKAFVQVSNDKLELTDRLQSEQHLGREIKSKLNNIEAEFTNLKEKLHFKDEEMIRLSHENEEVNKQILLLSQELDRMRHYEAKHHDGNVLQQELMNANESIYKLKAHIKHLESRESIAIEVEEEKPCEVVINEATEPELNNTPKDQKISYEVLSNTPADMSETISISSTINLAANEAMNKLQHRFTRTMSEIADLTEEKQRLEHLVMQLQGETETIGEYIALYQNQRRLLKQREVEKDVQLQQIASDREEMKENLMRLNNLVAQLLLQHGVDDAKVLMQNIGINNIDSVSDMLIDETHPLEIANSSTDTAAQIISLLSEIKGKNIHQDYVNSVLDIQHCSCCSGKLETV